MSCTIVLTPSHSMTAAPAQLAFSPTRYHRAQSSPAPSAYSTAHSVSPSHQPAQSSSRSPSRLPLSASDNMADSVSMLAALPSLSKSLNNLPSLAGQSNKHVPVYEGMPSRAQKSSHEKLKMALGNPCNKDALAASDKKGFYASPFFSMTPISSSVAPPKHASYPLSSSSSASKPKTFSIYSDEDEDEQDEES